MDFGSGLMITDEQIEQLIAAAGEARRRSYAPYSSFPVGAALLVSSGRIFTGCNIENSSFGLTVCAERVALFKAVSEGERTPVALALVAGSKPVTPCGACRQVLAEFSSDMTIILAGRTGEVEKVNLLELLPRPFGPHDLKDRSD
jgi:cytidine deaminase